MQPMHKLCVGKGMHVATHAYLIFFFHHLVTWHSATPAFGNGALPHVTILRRGCICHVRNGGVTRGPQLARTPLFSFFLFPPFFFPRFLFPPPLAPTIHTPKPESSLSLAPPFSPHPTTQLSPLSRFPILPLNIFLVLFFFPPPAIPHNSLQSSSLLRRTPTPGHLLRRTPPCPP
jgi:hypothetical protein